VGSAVYTTVITYTFSGAGANTFVGSGTSTWIAAAQSRDATSQSVVRREVMRMMRQGGEG
jgi:hypothetical protein